MNLKAWIREIPDFPKPGILFKDITPLLKQPEAFSYAVDRMADHCVGKGVDVVAGRRGARVPLRRPPSGQAVQAAGPAA